MKYLRQKNREENTKNKKNPLKTVAIVLSTLALLLVLAAVGIGAFLWYSTSAHDGMFSSTKSDLPVPTVSNKQEFLVDADWIDEQGNAYHYRDDVISILLMGIDYMGSEKQWDENMQSNGGNADVLALVILNTKTFDFSILYIPRDTVAEIIAMDAEGNYIDTVRDNISVSHSYGDGKALSCQLTSDAVSRLLMGVPINRYAALNCDAIYALNELVGGVRITFDSDCTELRSHFTKGNTVTLSNLELSMLVTYRDYDNLDSAYVRGMRIMNVLKALFDQLKGRIMENPAVAIEILNKLAAHITTDLELSEITFLASNIGKIDFSLDSVIKLQGETVMGEEYAEFHADRDWIYDFVVDKFCVPAE